MHHIGAKPPWLDEEDPHGPPPPMQSVACISQIDDKSSKEESSRMVLTVTEDTPADMLAGSMELLVQLPQGNHLHTQKVTVQRSTPMMDLLVQIATAHKLAASSYTLQAIGERGLVLPHHPNTPIGALDALQVKLLPKNGSTLQRRTRQINQPFETTFRLQVHLPRNQLYVSRVSPRMNLGEILDEVCREKNLDRNKYELRHPVNLEERLDLSLSLQDYQLQEVTLYAKQGGTLGSALSSQDIMALQRQEERRRQLAKQSVFGFIFKKSKESSLSTDSLGARSVSPARSDETRSASPPVPPTRPQRKRRPAPKPPVAGNHVEEKNTNVNNNYNNNNNSNNNNNNNNDVVVDSKEKMVISHSRNSSDSSGYHEASVLSDNQDTAGRIPETLPRRNKNHGAMDLPRKLAHTSQASKSLGNLASASGMGMGSAGEGAEEGAGGNCNGGISRGISSTSLSSTGLRKKRAAPPPPVVPSNPIISASTSTHALERIIDSEESSSISNDQPQKPCDSPTIEKADSDLGIQIVCKGPKKSSESLENSKLEEIDNHPNSNSTKREETKERETKRNSSKADFKKEENKVSLEKEENLRSVDLPEEEMIRIPFDVEDAKNVPAFVEQIVEPNVESLSRVAKRDETDETDILLQRVSETLCSTLTQVIPPPPRHLLENDDSGIVAEMEIPNIADNSQPSDPSNPPAPSKKDDTRKSCDDVSFGNSPNLTLGNSQQDTSDYVSAIGEDLSITDWEYQLPAPPSAFRDDSSPENPEEKFDKEEPEAAKDPPEIVSRTTKSESTEEMSFKSELVLEKFVGPVAAPRMEKNCETSNGNSETRLGPLEIAKSVKEELEKTFANEGPAKQERNRDKGRGNQVFDSSTLPNFKITTYKRQESLDIFGEGVESKVNAAQPRNILEGKNEKIENTSKVQSIEHIPISEPKITRYETAFRRQQSPLRKDCVDKSNRNNNKSNVYNNSSSNSVQRSKSYIAMTSNEKFRKGNDEMNVEKKCNEDEKKKVVTSSDKDSEISRCRFNNGMQKSISITNLNESGNMEKYSQWRESALKRQVEPTAEKQLQSLKVLKSILPQLKKNQQTENNAVHETDENLIPKNTRSEKEEPQPEKESVKLRQPAPAERQTDEKSKVKRYTYAGPPSINISSWSERPCINVQIKNDTDYKFERDTNTGAKTIVSLNGSRDVTDSAGHETKSSIPKKTGERVKAEDTKENSDQKKFVSYSTINSGSGISKVQEEEIPEWPMNFKKLTETFDKNVCLRLKPKRTTSRFSAEANFNGNCKDSGNPNVKMTTIGDQTLPRVKRYTSIVGINSQNAADLTVNGHFVAPSKQLVGNAKMNGPVVKGIQNIEAKTEPKIANSNESHQNAIPKKCSSKEEKKNFQVPKPPTMPVITGVTLKNCNQRPKSVPANFDPRDALLESIRNFGREKLRGAADRY